jgi:MOSC domain-containing protein
LPVMASVVELWRYPVKSMAGERLDSCTVTGSGLDGDRRWALVDGAPHRAGKLLTIKHHDRLLTYHARLAGGGVDVSTPDGTTARLDGDVVRRLELESSRPLVLRELPGGNFDDAHILIVNLASVAVLGLEAGMKVDHRRFRANLYVEGIEPDEEVGWVGRRIRAGDAELEVTSRCERCVVITKDPDTTEAAPELLRLLAERHDESMGVYCQVVRPGRVAVGDHVGY